MGSTGMRVHPHHMQAIWHEVVSAGDELAVDAPLADKSTIICRTGQLMLASGTGAWRVRDSMNRVARVLGVTVHVDLSLLSIECTCIEGHESFSEVVSLPTTGVNTHRIWLMEDYIHEIETQGAELTVRGFHNLLDVVEKSNPDYGCLQLGLAAACACGAFVFLLGGGPFEMLCAFVGAGMGNYMRVKMLARKLGQFSCISCGVATACVCYLAALTFLAHFDPAAMNHEAGNIMPGITPSNTHTTRDGRHITIGANGDAIFRRLMRAMGREDLAEDPTLADNAGRDARRDELYALIDAWVAQHDEAAVLATLAAAEVPASRIYSVADMFADPQFLAREMLHTVTLPDGRDCRMPGVVPRLSATPGGSEWIGPALGEHTDAVLRTLGYAPARIEALRQAGAI